MFIDKLKRVYWSALQEKQIWVQYCVSLFPGKIGQLIRARYYSKRLGACGKELLMDERVKISSPELLFIGNHVGFNIGAYITAGGKVTIGNFVGIGPDVKIWSVNHIYKDPHTYWMKQGSVSKEVRIEDDVWIATGSIILPGVTIGKGAIISAGSVVSKSIPPFAIVAGNPGRVIGWRLHPDSVKDMKSQ